MWLWLVAKWPCATRSFNELFGLGYSTILIAMVRFLLFKHLFSIITDFEKSKAVKLYFRRFERNNNSQFVYCIKYKLRI